jgi:hypothetical protein
LALASLLHEEQVRAATAHSLAARPPHFPAKAKSVIFLFMAGGPSHVETFDPKPLLNELDGQPRPKEFGEAKYQFIQADPRLLGTRRTFKKHGESGIEVSDLFPHIAGCIETRHPSATAIGQTTGGPVQLFSGRRAGISSMGSWLLYLGSRDAAAPSTLP